MIARMVAYRKKKMEQLRGKLRQKEKDGSFYYHLTVANGVRKEFSLKTCDEDEARQKATALDSLWEAPTEEVAFAQINALKGFARQAKALSIEDAWNVYEKSPNRAHPKIPEQKSYYASFREFAICGVCCPKKLTNIVESKQSINSI